MGGHCDERTICEHKIGIAAELLDATEDVVPTATVQAGTVFAQFVEDFFHLEGGEDGLNQDGRTDRATRNAEFLLGQNEDIVP